MMRKRLIIIAALLFVFVNKGTQAQVQSDDSVFLITVGYRDPNMGHQVDEFLLPANDQCVLDVTNLQSYKNSIQSGPYQIPPLDLYFLRVINALFADSLESYRLEKFCHNLYLNRYYKVFSDVMLSTTHSDGYINISVDLIVGTIKYNVNNIPISIEEIKEIQPARNAIHVIENNKVLISNKKEYEENSYSKRDTIFIWKGSWDGAFQDDDDEVIYMTTKRQDGFLYQEETRGHKYMLIIMAVRYSCDSINVLSYNNQKPLRAVWIPKEFCPNLEESKIKIAEDMLIIRSVDFFDESGNKLNEAVYNVSMIDEKCLRELYGLVLQLFNGARIYSNKKRSYYTKEEIEWFGIAVTPMGIECFQ